MIPYADFLSWGLLAYLAVPALLLGVFGRSAWRWTLLATLIMAVAQYGWSWSPTPGGEVRQLWLVLGWAVLQWGLAGTLLRLPAGATRRRWFPLFLLLGLAPLAAAKILPRLVEGGGIGFMGLSYVTFRSLDVLLGIHDGLIPAVRLPQYLTYVFFFPTISSGPIDRWRRFQADLGRTRTRAEFLDDLDRAVRHLIRGVLYKFVLAILVKTYLMDPYAHGAGLHRVLPYMYGYSAFLFFDFAGYSAFAVGASYLFGIHTPENFDRPFLAANITEFWNRWHISLSTWFRDHIYMRFLLAAKRGRWFQDRYLASYLGYLLTFGLMGVWHGTELHYVIYGFYHALLFILYNLAERLGRARGWQLGRFGRPIGVFVTANAVCFGFLVFSGRLG